MRLTGDYVRDEQEQAAHLRELLDVFIAEGVDAAFACTFVCYGLPHRDDPREDRDMVSWGVDQGPRGAVTAAGGEQHPGLPPDHAK